MNILSIGMFADCFFMSDAETIASGLHIGAHYWSGWVGNLTLQLYVASLSQFNTVLRILSL